VENKQHIAQLFQKYLDNGCSPDESRELFRLMQAEEHRVYFEYLINTRLQENNDMDTIAETAIRRVFDNLNLSDEKKKSRTKKWRLYLSLAASAIVVFAFSFLFLPTLSVRDSDTLSRIPTDDVVPGGNRATLTLMDGQTVSLDERQAGIIVGEKKLIYTDGTDVLNTEQTGMMSLSTPRGGTYQLTLPDGTRVWLNAASTLKYPSRFDAKERVVELEGEAYFEVSHQLSAAGQRSPAKKIPFRVVSKGQTVEVLGTQFNVSAYPDDIDVKTTLVEGTVRVTPIDRSATTATLSPGEQSILQHGNMTVKKVDTAIATDWKNGDFLFVDEELQRIMRRIARWYDIEVVYQGEIPNETFGGQISRHKNLSEILRILELSGGIRFNIADKKLYISQ